MSEPSNNALKLTALSAPPALDWRRRFVLASLAPRRSLARCWADIEETALRSGSDRRLTELTRSRPWPSGSFPA